MDSNINFSRRIEGVTLYDNNLAYELSTYKLMLILKAIVIFIKFSTK